jgi:hypothetical protein
MYAKMVVRKKIVVVKTFKKSGIGIPQETCYWWCLDDTEGDKLFEEIKILQHL